jgi:predicted AlkP superfamily pyrophosphatase or phosphodiesterase
MQTMRIVFVFIFCPLLALGQAQETQKPKLVVGIVVDQMRQEYLFRFAPKFGEGGFRKLMSDGFMLRNAHYNYVPTITGPGHASVYSGTTPAYHGIIGNDWYDKALKKDVNCVGDPQQTTVGTKTPRASASPWRMLTTTITDELKLATQKRAKVIGMSFKDRGAILPAGHMPDGAFWYDAQSGKFITSTYYMQQLPNWVDKFNEQNLADKYLNQQWTTLLPIEKYTESGPDDTNYENKPTGKDKPVFPYNLKELRATNGNFELLSSTPFGNDYLTEFAKAALASAELGADETTDFLTISYSAPDAIGHSVGPNAVEIEDTYLRLDRSIADLLKTLDQTVGAGKYTVFLTADHAVADVAQYLKDSKIPSGYFKYANLRQDINVFLQQFFPGREIVEAVFGEQIFINQSDFQRDPKSAGVDMLVAGELIAKYMIAQEGVANVFTESEIRASDYAEGGIKGMVTRGFHPKRSGDVIVVLEPGWYGGSRIQGSTHGSPYAYDTHVPIIFYGAGIRKGSSVTQYSITDIAPTLAVLLEIKFPNGTTGRPVEELFDNK